MTVQGPGDKHNIVCAAASIQSPSPPSLSPPFPSPTLFSHCSWQWGEKISRAITLPLCLLFSPLANHCLSFQHTLALKGHCSLSPKLFLSFSIDLFLQAIFSDSLLSPKSPLSHHSPLHHRLAR